MNRAGNMRDRRTIRIGLAIVVMLTASATSNNAFAQGGNVGGTIAKEGKLLSGDQSASPPARQSKGRPSKAGRVQSAAVRSLTGTWRWTGQCARYNDPYVGTVTFQQTGNSFSGTHGGTNMWDQGTISNGRIVGNRVSFQRKFGQYTDDVSLTLSTSGRGMSGIIPDTAHSGRCVMNFSKL